MYLPVRHKNISVNYPQKRNGVNNTQSIVLATNWTLTLRVCCVYRYVGKMTKTLMFTRPATLTHERANWYARTTRHFFRNWKEQGTLSYPHPKWDFKIGKYSLLFQKPNFIQKFQDFVTAGDCGFRHRQIDKFDIRTECWKIRA